MTIVAIFYILLGIVIAAKYSKYYGTGVFHTFVVFYTCILYWPIVLFLFPLK